MTHVKARRRLFRRPKPRRELDSRPRAMNGAELRRMLRKGIDPGSRSRMALNGDAAARIARMEELKSSARTGKKETNHANGA
ncbi:MAG: hypothetical protein KGH69_03675 [Candidatus Micrarchaeota archaeon]|nr:hypothetical protein [Candidatus Micrarchaeota archaeon]